MAIVAALAVYVAVAIARWMFNTTRRTFGRQFGRERLENVECTAALRADCNRMECSTTGDVGSPTKSCAHCGPCVVEGPPMCSPSMKTYCTNAECRWMEDLGRVECKGCEPCVTNPAVAAQPAATPGPLTGAPLTIAPITNVPLTSVPATGAPFTEAPATEAASSGCPAGSGLDVFCKDNGCVTTGDVAAKEECAPCGPCVRKGSPGGCPPDLQMWCSSPRRGCTTKYDLDSRPKVCGPCAPCIKATGDPVCGAKSDMMKHCAYCIELYKNKQLRRDLRESICYGCDPCYRDEMDRF